MPDEANFTKTACGGCGSVSDVDEGMVCCDKCNVWYHYRCVGVTEVVQHEAKWFCPEDDCQNQKKLDEQTSKTGTKKKKTVDDNSDKSSVKSDGKAGSSLDRELKALEKEQKRKEQALANERILREKRMEMDRILQEQRIQMETELRAKELEQEKQLLEKALKEKQAHLERMKKMRESFHDKMNKVQEELTKLKAGEIEKKPADKETTKKVKQSPSGPASNQPKTRSQKQSPKSKKQESENEEVDDEEEESEESGSNDESEDDKETSEDESESDESSEEEEEEEKPTKKSKPTKLGPHGLGQAPSKVQLAARSGISKKLPIFTGKPEEWPLFIGSYQATNEACGFSDVENLVRLQESLKGLALESVRGQLLFPKSVPKVIEKLRQLYGRPEQLLQCHLEKVRRLEAPKSDKLASYIPFGNAVEQLCEHLEAADLKQHLVNPLLIQDLVDKLPAHDKREWVRYKNRKKKVNLRTFTDFVSTIVAEACEANVKMEFRVEPASHEHAGKAKTKERGAHVYTHSTLNSSTEGASENLPKPCKVCNRTDHRLRFCQDFKALTLQDRQNLVDKWKLCVVCLNDHGNAPCKFKIRCNVNECRERHNPLLHSAGDSVVINAHFRSTNTILFRMLPVTLYCGNRSVNTLAFLDEGASVTLIESALADRLGVQGTKEQLTIKWTSDITRVEKGSRRMNLMISGRGGKEKHQLGSVRTVEELLLPKQFLHASEISQRMKKLRGLPIDSYENQRPGLLIGLNNLHVIAPIEAKVGDPGELIAVRSKLGWAIYGPNQVQSSNAEAYLGHHDEVSNQDLHDLLKSQYALENSVTGKLPESDDDRRAREILEKTTRRIGDRFETGLIWKNEDAELPDSYPMAVRRMKCLEQRLLKSPALFENVCNQVEEYQQKGYAHRATADELAETESGKVWYLPLNVVLNPKKPGKVRLVWDAAASVKGVSLNSLLLTGPDLLVYILTVFCQFRERPVAFGGDIREMYHQMLMRLVDRRVQRFIFRTDPEAKPSIYVMDVATFGSKSSPCSAQFVKNKNAMEFAAQYPEAAAAIVEKHYVDDYFDSVDTIEEAIQRAKQVRQIHSKGGFEIRNWVSNSEEVLSSLGEPKAVQTIHFNQDKETGNERVLGIIWNPRQDVFSFSTEHRDDLQEYLRGNKVPTKRVILSCVMGFFDPLGLLSCFTVHGKMLIQDLWRFGCEWDEEINDESLNKWQQWTALLPMVERIRIPRPYFGQMRSSEIDRLDLHIFTDASIHAYGCVAYFRAMVGDAIKCSLVMSRSKVAPLKLQSIPRLELMGAVLGARMMQTIQTNHSLPINRCVLWTDSQTVLSWLRSDQRKYKQFVAFRIGEILETTGSTDWRWIQSRLNLADALTKWGQGPPLDSDGEWFRGPEFLYQPEDCWPTKEFPEANTEEEMKGYLLHHEVKEFPETFINVEVTWRWRKLLRITAYVLRFVTNLRRKEKDLPIRTVKANEKQQQLLKMEHSVIQRPLQQEEFSRAEVILWKQAQLEAFPDEVMVLLANRSLKVDQKPMQIGKRSPLYKLNPILDECGVIRMNGRMSKSDEMPFDKKFPIILPKAHAVTKRLVQHYHEKFGHANRESVVNELRQKFYIPRMRTGIQQVMRECVWCKVNRCCAEVPMMAPLPIQRITRQLRPFNAVGVDYLGPVDVTVGRRTEKRWIALFTCLAVRAVHLEVVHGLTTQACLMAIRRFICKRGVPNEIFSDNGTNFKGASKEFIAWVERINNECADSVVSSTTKWHFNPPCTPHMGGIWERMVRSVKEAMKALDDGRRLTDEVLLTTLAEAEDMVNSRPLTYVPQESAATEAITPNHFLRGAVKSVDGYVDGSADFGEALRDMYKRSQYLADQMWQRWYKEYLPTINKRTKWFAERKSLKKGDLVFVVDGQNRKSWVRGIVDEVIVRSDGRVRQADVRTSKGVFRRGVANLAVLEVHEGKSGTTDGSLPELRAGVC